MLELHAVMGALGIETSDPPAIVQVRRGMVIAGTDNLLAGSLVVQRINLGEAQGVGVICET